MPASSPEKEERDHASESCGARRPIVYVCGLAIRFSRESLCACGVVAFMHLLCAYRSATVSATCRANGEAAGRRASRAFSEFLNDETFVANQTLPLPELARPVRRCYRLLTYRHPSATCSRRTSWLAKSLTDRPNARPQNTAEHRTENRRPPTSGTMPPPPMQRRQRQASAPPASNAHTTSVTLHFKERNNPKQPLCESD